MEILGLGGILFSVGVEAAIPVIFQLLALVDRFAKFLQRRIGYVEIGLQRPSVELLGQLHLFGAERLAMRLRGSLAMRAAVSDDGADTHNRGPILHVDRRLDRLANRRDVVAVLDRLRAPVVALEALVDVFG